MTAPATVSLGIRRLQLGVLILIGLGQASTVVGLFVVFRMAIEILESGTELGNVYPVLALLGGVMLANAALRGWQFAYAERMGYEIARRLRIRMYDHLARMYPREMQHRSRGALMLRLTGDVTMFRTWVSRGIANGVVSGIVIVGGVAGISLFDPWMGLALLGAILAGASISLAFGMWLRDTTRRVRRKRSLLTSNIQEQLGALATVQAFGRSTGEQARLAEQNDSMTSTIFREVRIRALLRAVSAASGWVGMLVVIGLGAAEINAGRASIGVVVPAAIAARFLAANVRDLGLAHDYWQRAMVSRRKIEEFLESTASRRVQDEVRRLRILRGRVELDGVTVGTSLHNMSVAAEPGDIVAITGPTGSGKSTLLNAISRLVAIDAGRVLVDDQDVAGVTSRSIGRTIGVLSPDLPLMRGTVHRNLTYRRRDTDESEVRRVALAWQLDEVLAGLADGLDGWVTEHGGNLSAGQRQRLMIARAVMGNPRILLLDDPTSHLDEAGFSILERIVTRHRGTVLIATHDPRVIAWADRIWRLEHGSLAEVTNARRSGVR